MPMIESIKHPVEVTFYLQQDPAPNLDSSTDTPSNQSSPNPRLPKAAIGDPVRWHQLHLTRPYRYNYSMFLLDVLTDL